jgi:molecular chaperone DnaK (HSP70)
MRWNPSASEYNREISALDSHRSVGLSRYVVGLDLGTTNCAMAYVDTDQSPWTIATFLIPQVVAPGQIEPRETLPSFLYQPALGEFAAGSLKLPWQKADPPEVVGQFARDHGTLVPGRMAASAKSWLCHSGVDRTADLLPWHASEDVRLMSPVAVSSRYL